MKNLLLISLLSLLSNTVFGGNDNEPKKSNKFKLDSKPTDSVYFERLSHFNIDLLDSLICVEVNKFRKENGLKPLKFTKFTQQYCRKHSKDMSDDKAVYHNQNEIDSIMKKEGIYIGECCTGMDLYKSTYQEIANHLVSRWKKSPPHRKGLLFTDVTHICCGSYQTNVRQLDHFDVVVIYSSLHLLYEK